MARRHESLLACKRTLAALTGRWQHRQWKLGFNGLGARQRRWLLVLAALVLQYLVVRQRPISAATAWQEATSGVVTNMTELQQQHEVDAAAHTALWDGMEELVALGPAGLEAETLRNCSMAMLDDEALLIDVSCATSLSVELVVEAKEVAHTANQTARRALRSAARQAAVAEAAAARAAITARRLDEANTALARARMLNASVAC